ncbi:uncharacterized protein [Palaemon carinicauda]|uniref:uncharacterized protein isoform X2 n=1 Tax=Palaemon carinicauda TaxID=392227 RepID=UPI0035B5B863
MGNTQQSQASVTKKLITDDNIKIAVQKAKGTNACIVSWTIKDFTAKGDNYVCLVTSIDTKYQLNGKNSSVSLIAKLGVPQSTKTFCESIEYAFVKECRVYEEIIPLLHHELTSVDLHPLRVPECYYATCEPGNQIIYLEDLRSRGFQTTERKKPLDKVHTTLILKEIARLHAASLLLRRKSGYENLDLKFPCLAKDCFDVTNDVRKMSANILSKHIEETLSALKEFEGYEKAIQWLTDLKPHAYETWMKQLDNKTKFAVICHGDCWTNNMLFRYDDQGYPVEVMLVDLQCLRFASLAIDLKMLFYHSLTGHERTSNIDYYLDIYYASFKNVMDSGKLDMPFTREELAVEYKSKHLYGCFWAMSWLPTLLSESDDIPDEGYSSNYPTELEGPSSCSTSQGTNKDCVDSLKNEKEREEFLLKFKKYPDMTSRFLSLFDDIIRNGDDV